MTLKELIAFLQTLPSEKKCGVGFHKPHSYRGSYANLAFEVTSESTVGELLEVAKSAFGTAYVGYKGGEFRMGNNSAVYLATKGETGSELTKEILERFVGPLEDIREYPDSLLHKAQDFATMAHEGATRLDNKTPFIAHPEAVAKICDEYWPDSWGRRDYWVATLCAAWLHDTVEDNKQITLTQIRNEFGDLVSTMVDAMTEPPGGGKPRIIRKFVYDRRLMLFAAGEPAVALIKLADMYHNITDKSGVSEDFRKVTAVEDLRCLHLLEVEGIFESSNRPLTLLADNIRTEITQTLSSIWLTRL